MEQTRNYQLQGSYTRYYDKLHCGFDSDEGLNKSRNFKTLEAAIKAVKKEFKRNKLIKIARKDGETIYDENGNELEWSEECSFWHVDGIRIVDRKTQKILWQE